jgi:hypothetical protein
MPVVVKGVGLGAAQPANAITADTATHRALWADRFRFDSGRELNVSFLCVGVSPRHGRVAPTGR